MWQYICDHYVFFTFLISVFLLIAVFVIMPFLHERMVMEWAYAEIEKEIAKAESYSDLKKVEISMIAFKKSFSNTLRGTDLWVKMNKMWDEQERRILPSFDLKRQLSYN